MARRARIITREDLLHRYANALGLTFGMAHDRAEGLSNEQLRERVEHVETNSGRLPRGRHASFARSQPTTSLHGQTR